MRIWTDTSTNTETGTEAASPQIRVCKHRFPPQMSVKMAAEASHTISHELAVWHYNYY